MLKYFDQWHSAMFQQNLILSGTLILTLDNIFFLLLLTVCLQFTFISQMLQEICATVCWESTKSRSLSSVETVSDTHIFIKLITITSQDYTDLFASNFLQIIEVIDYPCQEKSCHKWKRNKLVGQNELFFINNHFLPTKWD